MDRNQKDRILRVEIDNSGRLHLTPKKTKFHGLNRERY